MTSQQRYRRNLQLIEPFVYAQLKGIAFDRDRLEAIRQQCVEGVWAAQARVDEAAGLVTPTTAAEVLAACAASSLCAKVPMRKALAGYVDKQPIVVDGVAVLTPKGNPKMAKVQVAPRQLSWTLCLENANADCRQSIERLWELCKQAVDAPLSNAVRAECASLLDLGLNVKSTKAVTEKLNELGLPPMFKRRTRKNSLNDDESSQTKDAEALQKLFIKTGHPITTALLETISWRDKLEKECARKVGSDGRMHSSFAIVGPSCVAGDTYIFTRSGWRRIQDEHESHRPAAVWNGFDYHQPTRVKFENIRGWTIKTTHGYSLTGSWNHPVMTPTGWKKMDDLVIGDEVHLQLIYDQSSGQSALPHIKLPTLHFNCTEGIMPTNLTVELAELIGMWLADGTLHNAQGSYAIRISNHDVEVQDRFCELSQQVFGLKANKRFDLAQTSSRQMVDWFKAMGIGGGALTKVIPDFIMCSHETTVRAVLRGLTLDAHVKKGKVCYGTQSLKMRQQIQLLLLRLGIVSTDTDRRLMMPRKYMGHFAVAIGFVQSRKVKELSEQMNQWLGSFERIDHGIAWLKIQSKEPWQGDVYDVSMPVGTAHQYYANGLLVHNTDRTASYTGLDGSGGNAQNVPEKPINFRHCYRADPGHDWYRLDLTGADLWTVAARVAAEGDPTLLEDLRAGIRIPSLLGMMVEGYQPGSDRAKIRADAKAYKDAMGPHDKWKDACWKAGSHLSNYKGGPTQIQRKVIKDTYKMNGTPVDPGLARCKQIQTVYYSRYWGISRWWAKTAATIMRTGKLVFSNGREHEFLSRRPSQGQLDDDTLREALAAEPQALTTDVILTGVHRMWYDPTNWSGAPGDGDPHAMPIIPCVHDEADWIARHEDRNYITAKVPEWFTVPLVIAGTPITMPYAFKMSDNWGDAK